MPMIKIYSSREDEEKMEKMRPLIEAEMLALYGPGNAATLVIAADCRTCDKLPENFSYLEVVTYRSTKDEIVATLKKLKLGLDVFFVFIDENDYISGDEFN